MVALQDHHVVDIYDHPTEVGRRVTAYLAEGLERGQGAIVIASAGHRSLLVDGLAAHGIDVTGCRAEGLLVESDAEALLDSFYLDGAVDPGRFDASVGALERSTADWPAVRIVGEMVDLLCRRGDVLAGLSLEAVWNDLARRHGFSLYCCYDAESVLGDRDALVGIQEAHSHVVSAPASIRWMTCRGAASFLPVATAPRAARLFVTGLLNQWDLAGDLDVANMIVSELCTNAILHAETPFEVVVSRRDSALRIAVRDASRAVPMLRRPASTEPGGRGMAIVASLASAWAVETGPAGKTVWAEIALPPD